MTDFNQDIQQNEPESDNSWGSFFSNITNIPSILIENYHAKNEAIDKQNHDALLTLLNKKNWAEINNVIHASYINKFAHLNNNKLLFDALFDNQMDLARFLITLDNVKNTLETIDSDLLFTYLIRAAVGKQTDAALFLLSDIFPSMSLYLSTKDNFVFRKALLSNQWELVEALLEYPVVLEALNEEFRSLLVLGIKYGPGQEKREKLGHLLISNQLFQERVKALFVAEFGADLAKEEFDALIIAADEATTVVESIVIEEKSIFEILNDEQNEQIESHDQDDIREEENNTPKQTKIGKLFTNTTSTIYNALFSNENDFNETWDEVKKEEDKSIIELESKIVDAESDYSSDSENIVQSKSFLPSFGCLTAPFKKCTGPILELETNLKRKADINAELRDEQDDTKRIKFTKDI